MTQDSVVNPYSNESGFEKLRSVATNAVTLWRVFGTERFGQSHKISYDKLCGLLPRKRLFFGGSEICIMLNRHCAAQSATVPMIS
jgi:hypothetical protein